MPRGSYADIVTRLRPESGEPGDIVDAAGRVLGRHHGIAHFTVGQRKRLGMSRRRAALCAAARPRDPPRRRRPAEQRSAETRIRSGRDELAWRPPPAAGTAIRAAAKLRSAQPPVAATVLAGADGERRACSGRTGGRGRAGSGGGSLRRRPGARRRLDPPPRAPEPARAPASRGGVASRAAALDRARPISYMRSLANRRPVAARDESLCGGVAQLVRAGKS